MHADAHAGADIVASLISCVADQAPEQKGNNVLVVDEFALSVLNASVSLNELLKVGFISASAVWRPARLVLGTSCPCWAQPISCRTSMVTCR